MYNVENERRTSNTRRNVWEDRRKSQEIIRRDFYIREDVAKELRKFADSVEDGMDKESNFDFAGTSLLGIISSHAFNRNKTLSRFNWNYYNDINFSHFI